MSFFLGHYNINESLVKQSPKVLTSCFKSKTGRGLKLTSTGPGPAYYNPNDHIKILKKALFPWVLIILIFLLKGGSGKGPNRSRKGRGVTAWQNMAPGHSLSRGPCDIVGAQEILAECMIFIEQLLCTRNLASCSTIVVPRLQELLFLLHR